MEKFSTRKSFKGVIVAGTKSGSGKTTLTLALTASLVKRGLRVAPFKVGPDFIDPGHHGRIAGRPSRNLDGWMLSREYNGESFRKQAAFADVAVVEGVMGLFDGYDGKSESGSTAEMAKWLGLPVLLVVDARSMARSAAALIQGFERFDPELSFCGVIFNHVAGERHLRYLKEAMEGHVRMPCLGGIIHEKTVEIPERHLGLVTRQDHPLTDEDLHRLSGLLEDAVDVEGLLAMLPAIAGGQARLSHGKRKRPLARIGVAMDNAFCFYYPDNLELLQDFGAEVVPFSPVTDEKLPHDLDGLYLGGGYPEIHAAKLSENRGMRERILDGIRKGMPVYGECGGFMYLCRDLVDVSGNRFPMVGCFPCETKMFARLQSLGYREVRLEKDALLGKRGLTLRGHEFHYSELITPPQVESVYHTASRTGEHKTAKGFQMDRCLGSYVHLHFGSNPQAASWLVQSCLTYRKERKDRHETR